MKTIELIVTDSGKVLTSPDDGFVLYGALMKGNGQGGLLGSGLKIQAIHDAGVDGVALTNFEFFDALSLDVEVFKQYYDSRKSSHRDRFEK